MIVSMTSLGSGRMSGMYEGHSGKDGLSSKLTFPYTSHVYSTLRVAEYSGWLSRGTLSIGSDDVSGVSGGCPGERLGCVSR